MIGKGLFDGDLAIVDRSLTPRPGDVVVVDVDGDRSFKVWGRPPSGTTPCWPSPTRATPPSRLDPEALVEVWGVVSGSVNPRRRAERG